jgi:hypothetical protein
VKGASVSDGEAQLLAGCTKRRVITEPLGRPVQQRHRPAERPHLGPAVDGLGADESIRSCEATTLGGGLKARLDHWYQ